jgi:hypothetical protein
MAPRRYFAVLSEFNAALCSHKPESASMEEGVQVGSFQLQAQAQALN